MNRLEYNEVLKILKIKDNSKKIYNSGSTADSYFWNGYSIGFGGTYFAVINGPIPLEVANIIYEKYPNNEYGIRVNGGAKDWNPNFFVGKHNCLKSYHIDTKEGLIIFFTELQDYFSRKCYVPETEVAKTNEYIANVYKSLIYQTNPYISSYEWMKLNNQSAEKYFSTIEKTTKTSFSKLFRNKIDEFDQAVNPFINKLVILSEPIKFINKIKLDANIYNSRINNMQMQFVELDINENLTGNQTKYIRMNDGFLYQLNYRFDKEHFISASHYFSPIQYDEFEEGEVIEIKLWKMSQTNPDITRYNITKGTSLLGNITPDEKEIIYDGLDKLIDYATEVTVDNMKELSFPKKINLSL